VGYRDLLDPSIIPAFKRKTLIQILKISTEFFIELLFIIKLQSADGFLGLVGWPGATRGFTRVSPAEAS